MKMTHLMFSDLICFLNFITGRVVAAVNLGQKQGIDKSRFAQTRLPQHQYHQVKT